VESVWESSLGSLLEYVLVFESELRWALALAMTSALSLECLSVFASECGLALALELA
jgi:hypothetical protein